MRERESLRKRKRERETEGARDVKGGMKGVLRVCSIVIDWSARDTRLIEGVVSSHSSLSPHFSLSAPLFLPLPPPPGTIARYRGRII